MTKKNLFFIVMLFCSQLIVARDKVTKNNNEEIRGKLMLYQNRRFTLLLPGKPELTIPKDGIKEIGFDASKCSVLQVADNSGREEDVEPDCGKNNVGNGVFINKTGHALTLIVYKHDDEEHSKACPLSHSANRVQYYGFEAGSYGWKTTYGFSTSGGLFIPKCKMATPVII
jgi:hypothetical protein